MRRLSDRLSRFTLALLLALPGSVAADQPSAPPPSQLFRDFVAQADPAFRWSLVKTIPGEGTTTFVLELTSQQWRSPEEVDRTAWRHWLTIVRPEQVDFSTALLVVSGGSNDKPAPAGPRPLIADMARRSRSLVVEVTSVPNEPLTLAGGDKPLQEDALLAACMRRCLETGDASWLPRLPMVKSVVRAMDAVEQFLASDELPAEQRVVVDGFVITGRSKRGWTTWLVPIVDPRVKAIMPMVIDVLNVRRSMEHHLAAYGQWSPALRDYQQNRLLDKAALDRSERFRALDDPYTYRSLLTLPKYIVNASGDEYFVPDSSQFYFPELAGEKHLRYLPNTGHSIDDTDALEGALAFYQFILADQPRPTYSFRFYEDGAIALTAEEEPVAVRHWQATNPAARDFRLPVLGPKFTAAPLIRNDAGEYRGAVAQPAEGWTAHFIEAEFAGPGDARLKVSSGVQVAPRELPFADQARVQLQTARP